MISYQWNCLQLIFVEVLPILGAHNNYTLLWVQDGIVAIRLAYFWIYTLFNQFIHPFFIVTQMPITMIIRCYMAKKLSNRGRILHYQNSLILHICIFCCTLIIISPIIISILMTLDFIFYPIFYLTFIAFIIFIFVIYCFVYLFS